MLHLAYLIPLLPLGGFAPPRRCGKADRQPRRRLDRDGSPSPPPSPCRSSSSCRSSATPPTPACSPSTGSPGSGSTGSSVDVGPADRPAVGDDGAVRHRRQRRSSTSTRSATWSTTRTSPSSSRYLNLFVFSMLMLVLSSNLLVTFFGWEGVGVCSYLLIAFWFRRPAAASAGKKAMIYNRIGDARLPRRAVPHLRAHREPRLLRRSSPGSGGSRRRDLVAIALSAVPRCRRQVGADPAVPVARRRDGGPDPGLRADPRRDDGDGRRLPDVPDQPDPARRPGRRPTSWRGSAS